MLNRESPQLEKQDHSILSIIRPPFSPLITAFLTMASQEEKIVNLMNPVVDASQSSYTTNLPVPFIFFLFFLLLAETDVTYAYVLPSRLSLSFCISWHGVVLCL